VTGPQRPSPPSAGRLAVATIAALALVIVVGWSSWDPVLLVLCGTALLTVAVAALALPSAAPTVPGPATDPPVPLRIQWDRAVEQHARILSAYGQYELDPAMLLRYPAMWDLTASAVVDFQDALALAGSLQTEAYPGDGPARDYVDAVAMLRSDWARADRHARSTGTDGLAETDARACERGLKLLTHADATDGPEQAAYLEQVLAVVDGLTDRGAVAPPEKLHTELAGRVQRAIEA